VKIAASSANSTFHGSPRPCSFGHRHDVVPTADPAIYSTEGEHRLPKPANGELRPQAQIIGSRQKAGDVIVIEPRSLLRECITAALENLEDCRARAFKSTEEWTSSIATFSPSLILLGNGATPREPEPLKKQIALVRRSHSSVPIVLICDSEAPDEILTAIEVGVSGYIPTSSSLSVAVQAIRLVMAGGVYVPANSLLAAKLSSHRAMHADGGGGALFTTRQAAIVQAICRGKPNKTIAYDLNMCESTVKVHMRNIMKKLKAKNRTEVAVIASGMGLADPKID
jgi:DNA-binding NarL/FixJ family response regulator